MWAAEQGLAVVALSPASSLTMSRLHDLLDLA